MVVCLYQDDNQYLNIILYISTVVVLCILYSGKVWRVESLANLVDHLRFTKLKPFKLVVTINNSLFDLFICQTGKHLKRENLLNLLPAKLSQLYSS